MVILYGIKNCDTVKKARSWLEQREIPYRLHDYRVDGLSEQQLVDFAKHLGWEAMLNRSSTSWRQLTEEQRENLTEESALKLMLSLPTLIKRPILETGGRLLIGFKPELYQAELA